MDEIVLATRNKHKIEEIKRLLRDLEIKIHSVSDFAHVPEVEEDGDTLEENAAKKARTVALGTKKWALADDTGLEVKHLNGEPGVYSARWAGPECSYKDNNRKMLRLMKGVPAKKRGAVFSTVIALSDPKGKIFCVKGTVKGHISDKMAGKNGFGYDPVFVVEKTGKTFAQMSLEAKNKISHRGRALVKAKKLIKAVIRGRG
ncbi:MAG TPA: non-canonical purine NTP pyrophosphatase [Elusimicrobia bacterium]|nr:MAG: non-canonical purine NTP pyrophosphatase, RdgB/HAM1 family [Elusimicrobia bacterium RIFOXYA12_FULL_49_49]OGS10116.1 MAG: non-canonical purine NTP pyrophosphatase, RdgB/HAM1 family [Elusimicrobia bacterium RIFOXYA1_FULL_47_7]OGS16169.1 MAG: non-canonical purine NTP pyrophosphatase, RdgB/HAM1 family [Elusimicrobia bacterium RIFOXYA2_FULL_47_53]OGS26632.1 MAG: non-canonical purine NTP pyrophosphatase, RdgB/HAM1 family [Elusimicrobia bacterium RIFOXYB12_FULL_50_12]OGS31323.1 MAG: non-canoni